MCPPCTLLAKAEFDEFVWRDQRGFVQFANRMQTGGRFFDRHWPVFKRSRRGFDNGWRVLNKTTVCGQKVNRSIMTSSRIAAARRWIPINPLDAHAMRVEDAWRRWT